MDFNTRDQMLMIPCIHHILEKRCEYNGAVRQLFIDYEKACDSGQKYCTIFSLNSVYLWNKLRKLNVFKLNIQQIPYR